jgi:hypothetical protein
MASWRVMKMKQRIKISIMQQASWQHNGGWRKTKWRKIAQKLS